LFRHQTRLFVERELGVSLRARWFAAYALIFLAGGVLVSFFGLGDTVVYGYRGFVKGIAGLVHLSLLIVPVMVLIPAVASLADERDTGSLEYLLAQPVTFGEVYWGKWLGAAAAITLSVIIGFGAAATIAALRGVPPGILGVLLAYVVLLVLDFTAIGFLLAVLAGSRARATTLGILIWMFLIVLGTLGVMASFVRWGLPESILVSWSIVNPVEVFRLGVISLLDPDLSLLGPVGTRVLARFGPGGTCIVAGLVLTVWAVVPGAAGWWVFRNPNRRAD
jgi:ABC-2 type transport system permease protein